MSGKRFLRICLDGESFVFNQIRKIIAFWLMLISVRTSIPYIILNHIERALTDLKSTVPEWIGSLAIHSPFKFEIPVAPAEGPRSSIYNCWFA